MNLGHLVVRFFFLNSGNQICRITGNLVYSESRGVRDNESRLYFYCHLTLLLCDLGRRKEYKIRFPSTENIENSCLTCSIIE